MRSGQMSKDSLLALSVDLMAGFKLSARGRDLASSLSTSSYFFECSRTGGLSGWCRIIFSYNVFTRS